LVTSKSWFILSRFYRCPQLLYHSNLADPIHGGNKNMGSWKMIGFPGARADFIDWVDRYGARYPFDLVGVADRKG